MSVLLRVFLRGLLRALLRVLLRVFVLVWSSQPLVEYLGRVRRLRWVLNCYVDVVWFGSPLRPQNFSPGCPFCLGGRGVLGASCFGGGGFAALILRCALMCRRKLFPEQTQTESGCDSGRAEPCHCAVPCRAHAVLLTSLGCVGG
jgi:hypothetical protein